MTFVEAAVQILRREGKPLHVKELTRLAIKHNLLSVVGRDPEAMMETRLLIEAKRPSADLVRVSPGVFGLRVYPPRGERGEALKAEGESDQAEGGIRGHARKGPRAGKRRRTGRGRRVPRPQRRQPKPAETAEAVATPAAVEAVSVPVTSAAVDPPASEAKPAPASAVADSFPRYRDTQSAPATEAPSAKSSPTAAPDIAVAPVAPVVPTVSVAKHTDPRGGRCPVSPDAGAGCRFQQFPYRT